MAPLYLGTTGLFFFFEETDFLLLVKALEGSLNSTGKWSLTSRACRGKGEIYLGIRRHLDFSDKWIQAEGGWEWNGPSHPRNTHWEHHPWASSIRNWGRSYKSWNHRLWDSRSSGPGQVSIGDLNHHWVTPTHLPRTVAQKDEMTAVPFCSGTTCKLSGNQRCGLIEEQQSWQSLVL